MKKITKKLLLPVIAVLGLASCGAQEVKPEVAKQRAQKITEVQESEDFELPKKFYIDEDVSMKMVTKGGSEAENASVSSSALMSVDLENFQVYMASDINNSSESQHVKMWMYLEDNTFYSATELNGNKTYTKVTVEINDFNFEEAAGEIVNKIYDFLTGSSYLDLDQYEKVSTDLEIDFGTPSVTYTSTGDGNLGITQKASINTSLEIQGTKISTKGSSTLKIQFDNYILTSMHSEGKVTMSAGGDKVEITENSSLNVHLNKAKFSKPDLSTFTEAK